MQWLSELIERLFCWLPRIWLVSPDESGIRVTLGKHYRITPPGWYLYWPLIQDAEKIKVKTQVVDLRSQSLWTSDGQDLIVSGSIRYRISDAAKALLDVQDYDASIVTLSLGIIFDFVSKKTKDEIRTNLEELKKQVLIGLRSEAQGWGLKIENLYLSDIGDAQNIRILMNEPILTSKE